MKDLILYITPQIKYMEAILWQQRGHEIYLILPNLLSFENLNQAPAQKSTILVKENVLL